MALARRGLYLAVDGEGRTTHPGCGRWRLRLAHRRVDARRDVIAAMSSAAPAEAAIVFDRLGIQLLVLPPVEVPAPA